MDLEVKRLALRFNAEDPQNFQLRAAGLDRHHLRAALFGQDRSNMVSRLEQHAAATTISHLFSETSFARWHQGDLNYQSNIGTVF